MNVRICGPNLNDQSKGTFHVHATGCSDLKHYGPGKRFGGDVAGNDETLVMSATLVSVVEAVYDNGILDEAIADRKHENTDPEVTDLMIRTEEINRLLGDFWFAPCCAASLQHGEVTILDDGDHVVSGPGKGNTTVYECWIAGQQNSFVKLNHVGSVQEWVGTVLSHASRGHTLVIGVHDQSEYSFAVGEPDPRD